MGNYMSKYRPTNGSNLIKVLGLTFLGAGVGAALAGSDNAEVATMTGGAIILYSVISDGIRYVQGYFNENLQKQESALQQQEELNRKIGVLERKAEMEYKKLKH